MSEEKIKNFFEQQDEIKKIIGNKTPVIFLDYDGTLTPIVDTPDKAIIGEEMRALVQDLAKRRMVSIVSGRATHDVSVKVKIDNIFYAGSHGFEIISPDGEVTINKEAREVRNIIEEAYAELKQALAHIPGALVEDVKYTISAHYRLVDDNDVKEFTDIVDQIVEKYSVLRKTSGKKVFELRPKIEWDKGKAVNWILDIVEFNSDESVAIYVGDDTTDEDAFKVLTKKGLGILVADPLRDSAAQYRVKDVEEVKDVLRFFIDQ